MWDESVFFYWQLNNFLTFLFFEVNGIFNC